MIFELRFLRYGKHHHRPETIARWTEIAPDVDARSKQGSSSSQERWVGPKGQKLSASWIMWGTRLKRGAWARTTPERFRAPSEELSQKGGAGSPEQGTCVMRVDPPEAGTAFLPGFLEAHNVTRGAYHGEAHA
jgi:hypothetical protein